MNRVTHEDRLVLIRLPGLLSRHADVLSDFEAELLREIVDRYRGRGDRTVLTDGERHVLADAYAALCRASARRAAA